MSTINYLYKFEYNHGKVQNPLPMTRDSSLSKLDVQCLMYCLIFSLVDTFTNFLYLIGYQQAQFYSQQDIVHIMLVTDHCITLSCVIAPQMSLCVSYILGQMIYSSGRSRGGPSPLFWVKKENMSKGRTAGRAGLSLTCSRSGSATVVNSKD